MKQLPNGFIASASQDNTVKLWDLYNDFILNLTYTGTNPYVCDVDYINSTTLVSGGYGMSMQIWSTLTDTTLNSINVGSWVQAVQVVNSGKILISGSSSASDSNLHAYDVSSGQLLSNFSGFPVQINGLLNINDEMFASANDDGTVSIWNTTTFEAKFRLVGHTANVCGLLLINQNTIASGSWDGSVIFWDLTTGQTIITFCCHTGHVWQSFGLLNDSILVTGSEDQTIKLWQASNGTLLQTINIGVNIVALIVTGNHSSKNFF